MSASELFHIQELCDRIASHVKLDESPQDVSQTLCTSAQAQIFRHVSLDPWDSETGRLSTNGASLPAPLIEWFISPSCPFDFTHLVEADTDGRKADFLRVLNSARSSIRRLRMTESLASLVDLSDFPALTHLEIQGSYYETVGTLKPDNCVEAIVFHFRADSFLTNRHSGLYASVDAFVSTFSLPVLRQVEVQMRGSFYGPRTAMEHTLQCLPQYFPHLAGRGLLVITDYSLCEPNRLPPARPAHLMGDEGGLWRT
ncbi:hypothetical protein FB451DRAFT_1278521 [Mycena latifolia]|nr:hypothetical protein FB451DRAFT_1278521 [Mycena latifolia]